MAAQAFPRPATMADLEALPGNVKGEILDGVLYVHPRPRSRHQDRIGDLGHDLRGPFQRGRGGPGGWWILPEPGLELPGSPEVSPDLAGWRRERMPALPEGPLTVVPDWVCEILSPSTRAYDVRIKRAFYARAGVRWLWYVDLDARTVAVSRLEDGRWSELGVFGEDDRMRAEPFDAIEIALGEWWPMPAPPASD
jgi:Uma2 family endonuclease